MCLLCLFCFLCYLVQVPRPLGRRSVRGRARHLRAVPARRNRDGRGGASQQQERGRLTCEVRCVHAFSKCRPFKNLNCCTADFLLHFFCVKNVHSGKAKPHRRSWAFLLIVICNHNTLFSSEPSRNFIICLSPLPLSSCWACGSFGLFDFNPIFPTKKKMAKWPSCSFLFVYNFPNGEAGKNFKSRHLSQRGRFLH